MLCAVVDQYALLSSDISTSTPLVTGKLFSQSVTSHEDSFLHSTSHNSKAATGRSKVGTQPSSTTAHTPHTISFHICLSVRPSVIHPSVCQFVFPSVYCFCLLSNMLPMHRQSQLYLTQYSTHTTVQLIQLPLGQYSSTYIAIYRTLHIYPK